MQSAWMDTLRPAAAFERLPGQPPFCRNEIEIRVIGQMRSGSHAVIQWLQDLYAPDPVIFLNNIDHGDCDPFENHRQIEWTGFPAEMDLAMLRRSRRKALIYSYEDRSFLERRSIDFLASVFDRQSETNRGHYIGKSQHRFDLVIIRDPFNFLASRLMQRRRDPLGGVENLQLIKQTWKAVAQRSLEMDASRDPQQLVIRYNDWLRDRSYQRRIAARLHAPFRPPRLDRISQYGGGSSFGHQGEAGLAWRDLVVQRDKIISLERWRRLPLYARRLLLRPQKPFLTRWRLLAADEEYRSLFVDPEILTLSERLFGRIAGTRRFVAEVGGRV